ncbi:tail fiber assembly protein [Salmonella enterica]|uniref:Tail fiber assembly protein n=1 Tax=Salmonella enterica I TaxID=59201 RepID=A0A5U3ESL4_SALET|nr:tail fiber assembly protein [Salmonella enterica]EBP3999177.1 tail fiber assembly protein [Salmonella enterica subsp. enterica]EDD7086036.1 phage tail protein [Salmonella enterica subsp. enterica serovar Enteritidis]EHC9695134.1 tail fiber assembly protein [Salmonella enterica subsp. diarizonae]EDQ1915193.1 tail fiber assembly protein [Salmonella enterica subsp. enterica serovar Enteritidis]
MKYFKTNKNEIYVYDDDADKKFYKVGLIPITEEEASEILNPPPTHEELIQVAENERQRLLTHADKVMLDWRTELMLGEISDANRDKLSAWMAYKSEVKTVDVTTTPDNVNWPVPPEG